MFRPFELLKLIRDGVITNLNQPRASMGSRDYMQYARFIRGLEKLGLIKLLEDNRVESTEKLTLLQSTMDLSLTQLSNVTSNSIICTPTFGYPAKPAKHADVFVVMPFLKELQTVYSDHIMHVAQQLAVTIARGDDFFTADSIISDIWDAINAAKVIIADCTGRNPNVFYEIGIAHTLGKPVILTAQSVNDIPFDIQHIRTVLYEFTPRGMREYEKVLSITLLNELNLSRSHEECLKQNRP
ncbi:MAG: hypothetical protein ACFB14_16245 [Leptolyngbyaceae cyanobacterium]